MKNIPQVNEKVLELVQTVAKEPAVADALKLIADQTENPLDRKSVV